MLLLFAPTAVAVIRAVSAPRLGIILMTLTQLGECQWICLTYQCSDWILAQWQDGWPNTWSSGVSLQLLVGTFMSLAISYSAGYATCNDKQTHYMNKEDVNETFQTARWKQAVDAATESSLAVHSSDTTVAAAVMHKATLDVLMMHDATQTVLVMHNIARCFRILTVFPVAKSSHTTRNANIIGDFDVPVATAVMNNSALVVLVMMHGYTNPVFVMHTVARCLRMLTDVSLANFEDQPEADQDYSKRRHEEDDVPLQILKEGDVSSSTH